MGLGGLEGGRPGERRRRRRRTGRPGRDPRKAALLTARGAAGELPSPVPSFPSFPSSPPLMLLQCPRAAAAIPSPPKGRIDAAMCHHPLDMRPMPCQLRAGWWSAVVVMHLAPPRFPQGGVGSNPRLPHAMPLGRGHQRGGQGGGERVRGEWQGESPSIIE